VQKTRVLDEVPGARWQAIGEVVALDVADAVNECGGVEAEAFVAVVAPNRPASI
jgi:hypothetical protein